MPDMDDSPKTPTRLQNFDSIGKLIKICVY